MFVDKTFILPCLQPLKNSAIKVLTSEQEGSIINSEKNPDKIGLKESMGIRHTSTYYERVWSGEEKKSNILKNDIRDSIRIPKIDNFKSCKESTKTTIGKWEMISKWIVTESPIKKKGGTVILITHNNRMSGLNNIDQSLLPLINQNCNNYANNYCMRIEINKNKLKFNIAFPGFPNDGIFLNDSSNITLETDENGDFVTTHQFGGDINKYCTENNINDIDIKLIDTGIRNGLKNVELINKNKIVFYVIRNANAMHDKPINASRNILDSVLTPLGMFQSKILASNLKKMYKDDFKNDTILCSSFLSRSQLTGMIIIKEIFSKMGHLSDYDNLENDLNYLLTDALITYENNNKNIEELYDYIPDLSLKKPDRRIQYYDYILLIKKNMYNYLSYLASPQKGEFYSKAMSDKLIKLIDILELKRAVKEVNILSGSNRYTSKNKRHKSKRHKLINRRKTINRRK